MKKIFLIIIIFNFFLNNLNAANTKLKKNENYYKQITWKHIDFNLQAGSWTYYDKSPWNFHNFRGSCSSFLNITNKVIDGHYEICFLESGGSYRHLLGTFLKAELKNNKYDSCSLRPEYFYVKTKYKGASSNCFISRHIDPYKELFFPDDPEDNNQARLKKYIKDNSLKLPKIGLQFSGFYYSNKNDKSISYSIIINPEAYGSDPTIYENEENSEYHRNNIELYPEKKNFFKLWTRKISKEHSFLENQLKSSNEFKLD